MQDGILYAAFPIVITFVVLPARQADAIGVADALGVHPKFCPADKVDPPKSGSDPTIFPSLSRILLTVFIAEELAYDLF
jgi:hypothetical protein